MYTIKKIFNNNVILAQDGDIEVVLMGKGIGFSKSTDQTINEDEIQKVFRLHDDEMTKSWGKYLSNLSKQQYEMIHEIIEYADDNLDSKLDDYIYLSMSDHIEFAIERHSQQLNISNPLVWEVQNLYPEEYRIGLEALRIIEKYTGVQLEHEEASSIALHIINASTKKNNLNELVEDLELVKGIVEIVKNHFSLDFTTPSLSYERFLLHLKFFTWRLRKNEAYLKQDNPLYASLKKQWPDTYHCVKNISRYVEQERNIKISDDESFYLTVHIQRLATKEKNK
ncbi:BglG family transcription antiterminator LicT [Erysipelothrix urinaevulpis]|uniref:BglG family transcription antiterminator LicT n=1 Tax=Erysipelothrix urinaevulpis TaxID=2683717 RepID=UPI0013577C70|nr:PRD domain-containing protein [Erysipelothrix urinaevulpis]